MLRFTDNVTLDTQGPLRVIHLSDGYYVLGQGYLIPVSSREKGMREIEQIKASLTKSA